MHDNDFKDDDKIIDLSCTVCAHWASGTDVVFGCRNTTGHLLKRTFSLSVSRAEVASSSSRILGSRMIALAMAMRCFWPRESCEPWAPTLVLYFCASRKERAFNWILDFSVFGSFHEMCAPTSGRDMTKAWSWAFLAAAMTSSMLISRELSPYLMFSAMLQSNKMGSCDTMPILERRKGTLTRLESWPSINCKEQLILPFVKSSEIINEWQYNPLNELSQYHLCYDVSPSYAVVIMSFFLIFFFFNVGQRIRATLLQTTSNSIKASWILAATPPWQIEEPPSRAECPILENKANSQHKCLIDEWTRAILESDILKPSALLKFFQDGLWLSGKFHVATWGMTSRTQPTPPRV